MKKTYLFLILTLCFLACKQSPKDKAEDSVSEEKPIAIEMVTTKGTIVLKLYNETPLHRDNFVRLVNEKAFDNLLFHRVIENFMVQAGDPDSRNAKLTDTLGVGDLPYKIDAEINTPYFHKKGTLGAARDGNVARASSAMQFYIVQGKVQNDSLLSVAEGRINGWLAEHYFKNDTVNKSLVEALQKAESADDFKTYTALTDTIMRKSKSYTDFEKYTIPEAHREVYKTIGGTPHLDQNYTVFGEVVDGLEVIDAIAKVETNNLDRPLDDVRIISVRILEN
ncbi:peptidylprolyl isomerase [Jejudonia soesokkakensis]|uniref:peptidylprolyl isomerase n=1 Tax=Jejudonia soesokkakensis TaxID=1323432 RepID=A0ABW2MRN4_9FLAO